MTCAAFGATDRLYKCLALAEMGDRLATIITILSREKQRQAKRTENKYEVTKT